MKKILALFGCLHVIAFALITFLVANHQSTDPALYLFAVRENETDAIKLASEVGRLDAVSLVLSCFGLFLAFAFLGWMTFLRIEAKTTARDVAEGEAQAVLNKFIQDRAPGILKDYLDLLDLGGMSSSQADEIGRHSGDKEERK